MENARPSFLSFRFDGFSLKIAALSFMTLDHIGAFIEMNYLPVEGTPLSVAATVLRAIGRLAFPLFVFFLAEGMRYTHDRGNYCLRFAILAAFILICQAGLGQIPGFGYLLSDLSQPFIDLLLLALIAFFYEKGGKWRFLIALPVAYILVSAISVLLAMNGAISIYPSGFIPAFLLAQYNILGLFMFIPLYFAPRFLYSVLYRTGLAGKDEQGQVEFLNPGQYGEKDYRRQLNALYAASVAAVFVLFWALSYLLLLVGFRFEVLGPSTSISFEMYGILAAFFLLLYGGKRGYHAKWWMYFEWSYFPVHIALLAAIFYVISL